jgi:Holliday junction resolvase-like predicted endonuclease
MGSLEEELSQIDIYQIRQWISNDLTSTIKIYGPIEDRTLERLASVMAGTISIIKYAPDNRKTDLTESFGQTNLAFDKTLELCHYMKIKLCMKGGTHIWLGSVYSYMSDHKAFEKAINGILISGDRWKVCFYEMGIVDFKGMNLKKAVQERLSSSKGAAYESFVGSEYEAKGYAVNYYGIEKGVKDSGIDLIASKENKLSFVQCKNWMDTDRQKITHTDIKAFFGASYLYLLAHRELFDYKLSFHFVVSDMKILDDSARIFLNQTPQIKCIEMVFEA